MKYVYTVFVLLGSTFAVLSSLLYPFLNVFVFCGLPCNGKCYVDLYLLFVEAAAWTLAAFVYYASTHKLRRQRQRWLTLCGLYGIAALVFTSQFLFMTKLLNDNGESEVYTQIGNGGFTLLTLLLVLLTFLVKKNRKPVRKLKVNLEPRF